MATKKARKCFGSAFSALRRAALSAQPTPIDALAPVSLPNKISRARMTLANRARDPVARSGCASIARRLAASRTTRAVSATPGASESPSTRAASARVLGGASPARAAMDDDARGARWGDGCDWAVSRVMTRRLQLRSSGGGARVRRARDALDASSERTRGRRARGCAVERARRGRSDGARWTTTMSSSLRNAVKRKTHKERAQPSERKRYGLLEKKKDYVLRARDYHKKEDAINALKRKAAYRNPDEFYFAMQKTKTEDGVHVARTTEQNKYTEEELRVMKTQDVKYVQLKAGVEAKRVEKLKRNLHSIGAPAKRKHTVFVDTEEDAKNFDAAEHFDTERELVGRAFNRPRRSQLEDEDAVVGLRNAGDAGTSGGTTATVSMKKLARMQKGAYKTYTAYDERAKKLKGMTEDMAMQKVISYDRGHKTKITKTNPDGTTTTYFKWKQQRKK